MDQKRDYSSEGWRMFRVAKLRGIRSAELMSKTDRTNAQLSFAPLRALISGFIYFILEPHSTRIPIRLPLRYRASLLLPPLLPCIVLSLHVLPRL
ncbi:uncharacterized protein LAESUDRAFT_729644, partial [Laetiporus sulphureus 93-53]